MRFCARQFLPMTNDTEKWRTSQNNFNDTCKILRSELALSKAKFISRFTVLELLTNKNVIQA